MFLHNPTHLPIIFVNTVRLIQYPINLYIVWIEGLFILEELWNQAVSPKKPLSSKPTPLHPTFNWWLYFKIYLEQSHQKGVAHFHNIKSYKLICACTHFLTC